MTSESETKPHIVYPKDRAVNLVDWFPNYAAAFNYWRQVHTYQQPYLIAQIGRVIDPSSEIVDVSE
jgi:hypothetical protein